MKLKENSRRDFIVLKKLTYSRLVAVGFFLVILVGTALLMLPCSSRNGISPAFVDAFFTAVSATCVTGLVVCDTYTQWTLFGQTVIIILIQIGGLGFMTIITMVSTMFKRRISLRERSLLSESVNSEQLGGIVRMARKIVGGTLIFEGVGAVLLAIRFIPKMGWGDGLYSAVFMSISAFCNAGFDLNGRYGEYSSLVEFYDDGLVLITVMCLVLIGGIGFFAWADISKNKLKFSRYKLHTKMVLSITAGLTIFGALIFFFLEREDTLKGMNTGTQILSAFFLSVSPRTAGFNTVDLAQLSPGSKLLNIIYMFIGGSPGSTAGGAKTTTIAVLIISAWSSLRNHESCNVFGRRLEEETVKKSVTVVVINLLLALTAIMLISAIQRELSMGDIAFEIFSAIDTVGMTTGITRDFNLASKLIVAFLMFCGRVGSISFILMFAENKKFIAVKNPTEKISIG